MSLEQKIEALTAAIEANTKALLGNAPKAATPRGAAKPTPAPKGDSDSDAVTESQVETETTAPVSKPRPKPTSSVAARPANVVAPKPVTPPAAAPKPATDNGYAAVSAAIKNAVASGHRKGIKDMLAEYDAATGQDLTPDVYEEVLAKIAVIVGDGVDDLA